MPKKKLFVCAVVLLASMMWVGGASAQLSAEQQLGKLLYFDKNLSINNNQSCASCHSPRAGFADPDPKSLPVSGGSVQGKFGGRNAPSAAYAAFTPSFFWDSVAGLFVGGQFWDGRAPALSDQAAGPPLNPVEMALPDKWAAVDKLRTSGAPKGQPGPDYVAELKTLYNIDLDQIRPYDWNNPPAPGALLPPGVLEAYDRMARAIGEYEKTPELNAFTSKYDYFLAGLVQLSPPERRGLRLFEGKAQCSLCHLSQPSIAPDGVGTIPPLFTDYTYDNLGLPVNADIAALIGAKQPVDGGLGARPEIKAYYQSQGLPNIQRGKFKVMTLRNIAATAPYGHNGVFARLRDIVHFYNTRDTLGAVCADNNDPGFGKTCWPAPEVPANMNVTELGNLGMTGKEEADVVAFLRALTDGYVDPATGKPPGALPPVVFPPMP